MNKCELIAIIAQKSNLSKKDAESALNSFIVTVETAMKSNEKVVLVDFGTFEVRQRATRFCSIESDLSI